jgi:hypothetical protein
MPVWHKVYFELKAIEKKQRKVVCLSSVFLKAGHKCTKVFPPTLSTGEDKS